MIRHIIFKEERPVADLCLADRDWAERAQRRPRFWIVLYGAHTEDVVRSDEAHLIAAYMLRIEFLTK